MAKDGTSIIRVFQRCEDKKHSVLVIKDQDGYIFGGYAVEAWEHQGLKGFYGSGENLLFTFRDTDQPELFSWKGIGNAHMFADDSMIGMGGSPETGFFALCLNDGMN